MDVSLWFVLVWHADAHRQKAQMPIGPVVADPEFKQALAARGYKSAISSSPEQLAEFLDKDYVKFRDLIRGPPAVE